MFALSTRNALVALVLAGSAVMPSRVMSQQVAPATAAVVSQDVSAVPSTAIPPSVALPTTTASGAARSILLKTESTLSPLFELAPVTFPAASIFQDRLNAGPNIALMAVGGAALVIGLAIGGDTGNVVAATGGVMGLIGLYRYLR